MREEKFFNPHASFIELGCTLGIRSVVAPRQASRIFLPKIVNNKRTYLFSFQNLLLYDLHHAANCP